jgi:hypothetical protein
LSRPHPLLPDRARRPSDAEGHLEAWIKDVVERIVAGQPCVPHIKIVPRGNTASDHYDHMEHLSVAAGVAADRFRHRDEEYMATVEPPR